LRILFLNQAFHPDVVSSAQHSSDLAARLAADGHEVHAIAGKRAYDNPAKVFSSEETWKGVQIHRIPSGTLGKRARWRRALDFAFFLICLGWRLIRMPVFDAVFALTTPPLIGFIAALFVSIRGGRLVYWVMDLNPDQAIAAGWLQKDSYLARIFGWMLRYTLKRSSRIVVLDRFMKNRVLEKGADPGVVDVIPPWAHDEAVRLNRPAREVFRREHGLDGKFVVMYSGNHSPCHPLTSLLEAAERLAGRPEIEFCFIGGGSEHGRVKAFAAEHRLTNIQCLPYQPIEEISGSLGSADLHVVVMGDPFVGIVHPCKIYNVLTLGIPVLYIGPSEGHIPEMVPADAHARWFFGAEHGDVNLIAQHILAASGRKGLGHEDQQHLAGHFSAGRLIGRVAESVEAMATQKAAAGIRIPWRFIMIAASLILCYAVVLSRLAKSWLTDPNMSHGFFVPLLTGFCVWQERDALRKVIPKPNILGLGLMILGAALLCIGPPDLDTFAFATRVAFVMSIVGAILYLRGFPTLRVLIYPLFLMLLMIPLPGFVIERITFPLQILASQLAEKSLELLGYSVLREGNILRLPGQTLSIAEACSGLRSLLALTFLGQAYVCMFDDRRWTRVAMLLLVIPIAVFANAMRIVVNAVAITIRPGLVHGLFHESTGWVVFVVAFLCIVMLHASFNRIGRRVGAKYLQFTVPDPKI
jgi:colanic acid biosynthesis glycosyl transferase WcaI